MLDELRKDYTDAHTILGEHGLLKQLTKRFVECALEAELTTHLGYVPHARQGRSDGNSRNGKGANIVQTVTEHFDIAVPATGTGVLSPSW